MRNGIVTKVAASTAILVVLSAGVMAQSPEQLVGTWRLVSTTNTNAQGASIEPFGPHPLGSYTFDANGHFTQVIVPGEKGAATGMVATFGDYTLSNGGKTLTRNIVGSQNLQAVGKALPLEISISQDEMVVTNATPSVQTSERATAIWKRVK